MFRHIRLAKTNFQKKSKTKKLPLKTPQKQKSKECSSELMLKTNTFQTHYISKDQFSKICKTKKLPPKTPPKNEKQRRCDLMN